MLSKELLTRWNREAIVHAKASDLKRLAKYRPTLRRRDPMDPRAFFETQQSGSGGGGSTTIPNFTTNGVLRTDRLTARSAYARTIDFYNRRVWAVGHCWPGATIQQKVAGGTQGWVFQPSSGGAGADASTTTIGSAQNLTTAAGGGGGVEFVVTAGGASGGLFSSRQMAPYIMLHVVTPASLTDLRFWFGVFSASPAASDTPAVSMMAFRYSNGVDTNFRGITDSGTGVPTSGDTGIAVAASTSYVLEVVVNAAGDVEFYINGTLTVTNAATLPVATTNMGFIGCYFNSKGAGTTNLTYTQLFFSQD